MKNSGGVLIGILSAAAGVVAGMLIAPKKGEELRKDIKGTAGEWSKKTGNLVAEGKEQYKSAKSSFVDGVNEFKQEQKKTV